MSVQVELLLRRRRGKTLTKHSRSAVHGERVKVIEKWSVSRSRSSLTAGPVSGNTTKGEEGRERRGGL